MPKTVLLVDDEQGYLEPLADALEFEGHRVLKAYTASDALRILSKEQVDVATIDVMLTPGVGLGPEFTPQDAGIYLCERIVKKYPRIHLYSLSVVNDEQTIRRIQKMGVRFLRKGETPLRTVVNMIHSSLTGIAFSTERRQKPIFVPEGGPRRTGKPRR